MSLDGFDAKAADLKVEPDELELAFERFFHNVLPHINKTQSILLWHKLDEMDLGMEPREDIAYGANYKVTDEIDRLIQLVRAMQATVVDPSGNVRKGITQREVRETTTATTSLMNLLVKFHEKLMGYDRIRAVEQATVEVLQQMGGEENVSAFVKLMEERLEE